jgi:glycosyltransferase involved in cell wall biosynthesis
MQARVVLHGDQDEASLQALYAQADVFVLPSLYEGYGMALAEALARGLPVISTRVGAIPDTVPEDAGLLVPTGDAMALRAALERVIDDPASRAQLAAGARRARSGLPTWALGAERFDDALSAFRRLPSGPAA